MSTFRFATRTFARSIKVKPLQASSELGQPKAAIRLPPLKVSAVRSDEFEDFFPEFIQTLAPDKFHDFFNSNNHKFTNPSWVFAFKKSFELYKQNTKSENGNDFKQGLDDILDFVAQNFDSFNEAQQDEILVTLSVQRYHHPNIVSAVEKSPNKFERSDYYVYVYLMSHLSADSPRFDYFRRLLKAKYFVNGEIQFNTHSILVTALDLFLNKREDFDLVTALEKKIIAHQSKFNIKMQSSLLQSYADTNLKQPNLHITDEALYILSNNIESLSLKEIKKIFEIINLLKLDNRHILAVASKKILDNFSEIDAGEISAANIKDLIYIYYTMSLLDVCLLVPIRVILSELPRNHFSAHRQTDGRVPWPTILLPLEVLFRQS
jgi:hypothetical protein